MIEETNVDDVKDAAENNYYVASNPHPSCPHTDIYFEQ